MAELVPLLAAILASELPPPSWLPGATAFGTGVLLLFVSLEFFYYWFHRASHTMRYFWNSHSVHHSPNSFTLAAAYRLGWFGKFSGAPIFFTPMALLGFEPTTILGALFLNLLY